MNKKKPIVILGGGPTGLAAAYRLRELKIPFVLLEKEDFLGGLSATLKYRGLPYEFGPHAFHLKDPKMISWLKKLLGKDFRVIPTDTKVYLNGQLFNYPLKAGELFRKINPALGLKILTGYFGAYLKNSFRKKEMVSFEDWGLTNFGATLYKLSFGDYTAKVWGMDPKDISYRLATNKLSRLNLGDILLKLVGFRGKEQHAYFKKYLYPSLGVGEIFSKMLAEIKGSGRISLASCVTGVKMKNGQIYLVTYEKHGQKRELECRGVISTLNLKDLAPMIGPPLDRETTAQCRKLVYRGLIIVYLVVRADQLPKEQWIYFVENKFRSSRLMVQQNLSPDFIKKSKSIIALEIGASENDKWWQMKDAELFAIAKKDLQTLGLDNLKIDSFFVRRIKDAYPIYRIGYEKNLVVATRGIETIDNLISTGRNGLFLNSDIHDCFQMGFEAAQKMAKTK
jgi:protoporphyrinogen oxidase